MGADHYWEIVGNCIIRGDGPTTVQLKLGYLISGPAPVPTGQFLTSSNSVIMLTTPTSEFNLEKFWDLESVGVTSTDDSLGDNVLNHSLTSCISRDQDGVYVARFPWKPDHPELPTNLTIAKQ